MTHRCQGDVPLLDSHSVGLLLTKQLHSKSRTCRSQYCMLTCPRLRLLKLVALENPEKSGHRCEQNKQTTCWFPSDTRHEGHKHHLTRPVMEDEQIVIAKGTTTPWLELLELVQATPSPIFSSALSGSECRDNTFFRLERSSFEGAKERMLGLLFFYI